MLFSILIAHYNNFGYFTECYESILKQTHQDFEIIIVDDCSRQEEFDRLKAFTAKDSRVKLYRNEVNKGVGYSKRRCAEMANGDFCGFVDPDDAIVETALEDALKEFKNNGISAVYSQFQLCDSHLRAQKIFPNSRQVKNSDPLFFNIFFELNHFFTFRKSAYDRTLGINPGLTSAVDQDLYLKIYETGKTIFIPKPNYLYRLHDKGVSQEKSKKGKLNQNWHTVLSDTLKRRNITKLYGKPVSDIENLPEFIFKKQNTIFAKLRRKLS